jgi:Phage terminase, small subunit
MTCREGHAPKWPDFEKDNLARLVHGSDSPRVLEAVARIREDAVVREAPWVVEPVFSDALHRYCRAEARARLLTEHVLKVAAEHGAGKVSSRLWESAVASDNAASRAAADLGLTPMSRAHLAALATSTEAGQASLARMAEQGRQIREARALGECHEGNGDREKEVEAEGRLVRAIPAPTSQPRGGAS